MKIYGNRAKTLMENLEWDETMAPVISVIGAGGKTSVIRSLSRELNACGRKHYILTTTHMWPEDFGFYGKQVGHLDISGKLTCPDSKTLECLLSEKVPILIEADGSRGLPCKAPELWEPVLLPETDHVIAVLGASALGRRVTEICHRPDRVMDILHCSENHILIPEDMAKLAISEKGLYKNVKKNWKYTILVNQVDNIQTYDKIKAIEKICEENGKTSVIFTCLKLENESYENID